MEKEKIKQLVDVMQAYVNGKTIQYYKVDLSFKINIQESLISTING